MSISRIGGVAPVYECNRCGERIAMTRNPDGGFTPDAMQFAEATPDGRMRLSIGLTCRQCIDAHPDFRPRMGEPFEVRQLATRATETTLLHGPVKS